MQAHPPTWPARPSIPPNTLGSVRGSSSRGTWGVGRRRRDLQISKFESGWGRGNYPFRDRRDLGGRGFVSVTTARTIHLSADSLISHSEKQPSDSQRGWSNSCFHISLVLFPLPASKTCLSILVSHSVTSWSRWGYHISFGRGDLEHYGVQKILRLSDR